ncbi:hypothetical protein BLOT_007285 [Blomia tropicalis]|nr:hypothetical protein BLOT_007285 [Blomia tropicalis]
MFFESTAFESTSFPVEPYLGRFAGSFQDFGGNGITGDLYLVNNHALFLYNFSYDGQGTEVYFKVGSSREPNQNGVIIPDELGRVHKLSKYSGQNLLLALPREITSKQVRWLSLWSNTFRASIGHVLVLHQVQVPDKIELGMLLATKDLVRAEGVVAVDDKTILIKKLYYRGTKGSNCGFYVGTGTGPNVYGFKIPDENGNFGRLRNYFNEDIILRLPRDLSLVHLDWFAINDPQQKQSYGYVPIGRNLNVPPNLAFILTYVTSFSNCETILANLMQVGWEVRHPDVYIQLEARIANNQYAAFGLSGAKFKRHGRPSMIGSDVFVVFYDAKSNKVVLDDYTITAKSQCNVQTRTGVCSDTSLGGTNNLELLMSSYIDGLIKVTFRRPLRTMDVANDLPFIVNKLVYVVAAIGTLDTKKKPSYHTVAVNTKFHLAKYKPVAALDFGRLHSQRHCDPPLWQQVVTQPANIFNTNPGMQSAEAEAHTLFEIEPWKPPVIVAQNGHVFRVVLGPTGNAQQGYTSITGIASPSKAFWIDDLLIPELHVTRGHNYTFIVETGDNATDKDHYHPFYITDNFRGGGGIRPELLNTPGHRVYAGIDMRWGTPDPRPGSGRYCELVSNNNIENFVINSVVEYRKTFTLECKRGQIGAFQWRVPDSSSGEYVPNLLYYQSYSTPFIGWKIIVSNGEPFQLKLSRILSILCILLLLFSTCFHCLLPWV